MNLASIEMCFQNYLQTGNLEIASAIVQDDKLTVNERLSIYFNDYRWRLFEILHNDYPKLQRLMDHEAFDTLCQQYLTQHPSCYSSIRYFGQHLSTFLQNTEPYCLQPYLHEMAQFEWALGESVDAADASILTIDAMKSLPLDRFAELQVRLHPSVQLIYFNWNIPELWQIIEQQTIEQQTFENQIFEKQSIEQKKIQQTPKMLTIPTPWLIYRSDLSCAFRSMTSDEGYALKSIQNSPLIATFCETLCEKMSEDKVPMYTLQCLKQWLRDGIISEIALIYV